MAEISDYQDEQRRQQEEAARAREEAIRLYKLVLGREPTGEEIHKASNRLTQEGRISPELGLIIAGEHQGELVTGKQPRDKLIDAVLHANDPKRPGLTDPKAREEFRRQLREFATEMQGSGDQHWNALAELNKVPVPFLNPGETVSREDLDTEAEVHDYLSTHGGDTELNRRLLKASLDYGGLSIEATPFGTANRPSRAQWKKQGGPGEIEQAITKKYAGGGEPTQEELAAIARERQADFRLEADDKEMWRKVAKIALTVPFAISGAALAGPLVGGAAAGLGAPGTAGVGLTAGTGLAGGIGAAGAGAAAGATSATIGSGGDPDAIWKAALTGGIGGALGYGLPFGGPEAGMGINALKGATVQGATNLASQGLGGEDFDWEAFAKALATGGATGATAGLGPSFPFEKQVLGFGTSVGNMLTSDKDQLADANAQLDQRQLEAERGRQAQMTERQEEWKRRYREAQAEAQRQWEEQGAAARAAQQEAYREAQQQWEAKKAEYDARLRAFLEEREAQIQEALRAMGLAEPGIASLIEERRKQIEAAQAEQAQQEAALVESRNFFPSQLLDQTGMQGGDFAQSEVLVPHSPPPVRFGMEGLPASFGDYSAGAMPEFSSEGFLPSGAIGDGSSQATPPMMPRGRPPRYFPTLLNGLTRSPYLRYA